MSLDWVAGFFDGEGTVGCWAARCRPNSKQKVLRAAVAQNDRRPLDKLIEFTGLGRINGPYKNTNGKNYHYRWGVEGEDVIELYKLLSGRLIGKQEQFDKALNDWESYRSTIVRGRPKTRGVSK